MTRHVLLLLSIVVVFLLAFVAGKLPFVDKPYLEAQFLNVEKEVEEAGEKFKEDVADINEVGCFF